MKSRKIFTYGSLRKGMHNYFRFDFDRLKEVPARLEGNFELFTVNGNTYPWLVETNCPQTIFGEIYNVSPRQFDCIEQMELGAGYKRMETEVVTSNRQVPVVIWVLTITSGDWVSWVKKNLPDYYKSYKKQLIKTREGKDVKTQRG